VTTVDHPTGELRVLHWNIHSWRNDTGARNQARVADLIRATDPHAVSLVEVDESWEHASTLDTLAADTGYSSIFVPSFEFGGSIPAGGFGNAVLSRLPVLAVRQRQLLWPPRRYDGTEPSEPRSVIFTQLTTASRRVWIGSTHLPRADVTTRAAALQQLAAIVQSLPSPWLLIGDYNTPADSWLGRHPSLRAFPYPAEPTYPAKEPVEAIDYCVAPQALPVHATVLAEDGSDHLPILVRCWPD
jgi:endonuclease/exonuclease/phosphatase family metal-dependent hydrolase